MARILAGAATLRSRKVPPPYMKTHRLRVDSEIKSREHPINPASLYTKAKETKNTKLIWCKRMDTTQTMRALESHLFRIIWAPRELPLTTDHHSLRLKTMEEGFTPPRSLLVLRFSFQRRNIRTYKATSCRNHHLQHWRQILGNRPVWNQITFRATWGSTLIQLS